VILNGINTLSALLIMEPRSAMLILFVTGVTAGICLLALMTSAAVISHGTKLEATIFAVLMGFFNLSQIVFGALGGQLFSVTGLRPLIIISGLLSFLGVLWVKKLKFPKTA